MAAESAYPPRVVVATIIGDFLPRFSLRLDRPVPTHDDVVHEMEKFARVRIDAVTTEGPPARTTFLVLQEGGKYATAAPKLEELLRITAADGPATIYVVAPLIFFEKPNMVEKFNAVAQGRSAPRLILAHYHNFAFCVPDHEGCPRHELLSDGEARRFLHEERLSRADLPAVHLNDPPILWLPGAREGAIVRITSPSEIAGTVVSYRQIVRGVLRSKW